MKEKIYYIGLNANNAICNESFFSGSITLYPTGEKGNIYYSNILVSNTESNIFLKEYKNFIYKKAMEIQNLNPTAKFICFNDKIKKICASIPELNIITDDNQKVTEFLNDKFKIRNYIKNYVPILTYNYFDFENFNYNYISNKVKSDRFVIQESIGAGGNNTYLVNNQNDISSIAKNNNTFCVSKYIENIPLNITMIISSYDIAYLPISVQLIKVIENKFKYVGGDFAYLQNMQNNIIEKIHKYSKIIGNKIQKMGYRGVLGIDYILTKDNEIYFMEINPRFQSSSFLLSINLEQELMPNIAKLHYLAITNQKINPPKIKNINQSFVNCNFSETFDNIKDYQIINNGYFVDNKSSIYRKVLKRSILNEDNFEKIN